jgi:hypothetical protein
MSPTPSSFPFGFVDLASPRDLNILTMKLCLAINFFVLKAFCVADMSSPIVKRFLLSIPILCLLYLLLSKIPQVPADIYAFERFDRSQEQLGMSFKDPIINNSDYPRHPTPLKAEHADSNGLLNADFIDPAGASKIKAPRALMDLTQCSSSPNQLTGHIRLPNLLYNISMGPITATSKDTRSFWNPTIIALPYWSKNQYVIVNMVASHGELYRRNVLCEANICHPPSEKSGNSREKDCTEDDLEILGSNGGLRCVTAPREVDVPPTPAERCDGMEQLLADIPGFHDPRLFYSGRGEPILMVVSQ